MDLPDPGRPWFVDGEGRHTRRTASPIHSFELARAGRGADVLAPNDGSGEVQVSHNARRSTVLRVSPYAGSVGHLGRSGQAAISLLSIGWDANGVDHRPNGGRAVAGDGDVVENAVSEDLEPTHIAGA